MSIGRNDPCPCGSGKKYKKCCLSKDEKARHEISEESAGTGARSQSAKGRKDPEHTPDPLAKAWQARWSEFQSEEYEGRFELFTRTLDDPDLMNAEMAFAMLNEMFIASAGRGHRDRFDALVKRLREHRPAVYLEEEPYFLKWRITNALLAGRSEVVSTLMLELAALAAKDLDIFNRAEEQVAYHGHLTALVDAMRLAWPGVKASSNIVPWGIDEFCSRAVTYELLNHASAIYAPNCVSPALAEGLGFFCPIDANQAAAFLADIAGRPGRTWTMSDFQFAPPRSDWQDEPEDIEESEAAEPSGDSNFYRLTVQFLGYLRRIEGVPYAKGELGRRDLHRFILERDAGKLEYFESMLNSMQRDLDPRHGRRERLSIPTIRSEQDLAPPSELPEATGIPGLAKICLKVTRGKPGNECQPKGFEHQTLDATPTDRGENKQVFRLLVVRNDDAGRRPWRSR